MYFPTFIVVFISNVIPMWLENIDRYLLLLFVLIMYFLVYYFNFLFFFKLYYTFLCFHSIQKLFSLLLCTSVHYLLLCAFIIIQITNLHILYPLTQGIDYYFIHLSFELGRWKELQIKIYFYYLYNHLCDYFIGDLHFFV